MSGRRTLIGFTVLCALAFSAVSAASASAAGTTAYTCKKNPTTDVGHTWTDPHCTEGESGEYGHEAFAAGTETHVHVTAATSQILKGEVGGIAVELESSEVEATTSPTSFIQNTDHGVEAMDVSGEVTLVYKNVNIKGSALLKQRCTVEGMQVTTKLLKFTSITGVGAKNTGIRFEPAEAGSKVFANVNFVTNPTEPHGGVCPIAGFSFPVEGKITAQPKGATLKAEPAGEELTLGGHEATLEGSLTVSGLDPKKGDTTTTPLSLTTTTP